MHSVIEVHEIGYTRNTLPLYCRACFNAAPHGSERFTLQPLIGVTVDALLRCRYSRIGASLSAGVAIKAVDLKSIDMNTMIKRNRLTYLPPLAPCVRGSYPDHGKTRHRNCGQQKEDQCCSCQRICAGRKYRGQGARRSPHVLCRSTSADRQCGEFSSRLFTQLFCFCCRFPLSYSRGAPIEWATRDRMFKA